jgi:hypothetical protein
MPLNLQYCKMWPVQWGCQGMSGRPAVKGLKLHFSARVPLEAPLRSTTVAVHISACEVCPSIHTHVRCGLCNGSAGKVWAVSGLLLHLHGPRCTTPHPQALQSPRAHSELTGYSVGEGPYLSISSTLLPPFSAHQHVCHLPNYLCTSMTCAET